MVKGNRRKGNHFEKMYHCVKKIVDLKFRYIFLFHSLNSRIVVKSEKGGDEKFYRLINCLINVFAKEWEQNIYFKNKMRKTIQESLNEDREEWLSFIKIKSFNIQSSSCLIQNLQIRDKSQYFKNAQA